MPDVQGKTLDVAMSDIEHAGSADDVDVDGGGLFGIVDESNWQVCEQSPAAGEVVTDAPRLTVDRSCDDGASAEESETPAAETTEATADADTYAGPDHEVVTTDEDQTAAHLTNYWAVTAPFDTSTDAYRDEVKAIITDLAHRAGTDGLIVNVVTDEEIARAEASSTHQQFVADHGDDYAVNTIPEKEKTGWVASYAGGFDYDSGEASDEAFAIDWWPAGDTPSTEAWRPQGVD